MVFRPEGLLETRIDAETLAALFTNFTHLVATGELLDGDVSFEKVDVAFTQTETASTVVDETCDVYSNNVEASAEINELCDGANQATMQVVEKLAANPDVQLEPTHPLHDAVEKLRAGNRAGALQEVVEFNENIGLYAPQSTQESAALLKGTTFTLRDDGTFEVARGGEKLLEVQCDGSVTQHKPIAMFTSEPCAEPACVPEVATVKEVQAPITPEVVVPAEVSAPTMQRVLVDPDPCSGCDTDDIGYTETMTFETRKEANEYLARMSKNPATFLFYQEELAPDEKFIIVDGKCYSIVQERGVATTAGTPSNLYISDGDGGGKRVRIPPEKVTDVLEGKRSFEGVKNGIEGTERTTIEIQEPVAPTQVYVTENGDMSLENARSVAERTVHETWYSQTDLTREQYAQLLAGSLPDAFFAPETTVMERAAMLYDLAREQNIPLNPVSAVNLAEIISQEQARGMDTSGSLRDVLERAAKAKVERVQQSIATPAPYRA